MVRASSSFHSFHYNHEVKEKHKKENERLGSLLFPCGLISKERKGMRELNHKRKNKTPKETGAGLFWVVFCSVCLFHASLHYIINKQTTQTTKQNNEPAVGK